MIRFLLFLGLSITSLWAVYPQLPAGSAVPQLVSGPMMGHISYDHARLWIQLNQAASVYITYGKQGQPAVVCSTEVIKTTSRHAFSHIFELKGLAAATTYQYRLVLNGEEQSAVYTFSTPATSQASQKDFTMVMGSCVYINDEGIPQRGGDYQIFQSMAAQAPDLTLWLGDNVYLHEHDWQSKEGMQYRYSHLRQLPEIQPLLQTGAHYAIWDDHDYGPNDSDRSFIGKVQTKEVFDEFWPNPVQQIPGMGIATAFSRSDCDFFLLDNRYFRSPQKRVTGERTILGKTQLEWLIDALCTSEAKFKFVLMGGLFLSSSYHVKNQNYISNYSAERTYLLDQIEQNNIKNVIVLSGDKHYAEVSKFVNGRGNTLYEITSSSLTAPANTREIINRFRVEGSHIQQKNFARLSVFGPDTSRQVELTFYDSGGNPLWSTSIVAE